MGSLGSYIFYPNRPAFTSFFLKVAWSEKSLENVLFSDLQKQTYSNDMEIYCIRACLSNISTFTYRVVDEVRDVPITTSVDSIRTIVVVVVQIKEVRPTRPIIDLSSSFCFFVCNHLNIKRTLMNTNYCPCLL